MDIKTFVEKDPEFYVRFGKCNACNAVVVLAGTKAELRDKYGMRSCHTCASGTIFFGMLHNVSGRYAEKKFHKLSITRTELP